MPGRISWTGGTTGRLRVAVVVVSAGCAAWVGVGGAGCSSNRHAERADKPLVVRDVPEVLRGTIGSETTLRGVEPVLISGFGIVVGLNGTGGGEGLDPAVQTTMERELARGGVSIAPSGRDLAQMGVSPTQFLRDKNVAVVIVEAAVPPAAPKGTMFDVRVRALPNSEVTSLEGGTLWTTDLRIGPATVFEGYKTHLIAQAAGAIFINPFAEPGKGGDAVTRTVGRVIGGGKMKDPLRIEMVLDNESHARARSIMTAINTRFPQGRNDEGPIAMGRDGSSLAIRVPFDYRDTPQEFIHLVEYTRVDQTFPQERACAYVDQLKKRPELAEALSWCLRSLGNQAVSSGCLHPMYDYPEVGPRLAALEVGAKLGDGRVAPYLRELAMSGQAGVRSSAIDLMGDMMTNPQVGLTLRELLDAPELEIRVSAYEAMAKRGDPIIERRFVGTDPSRPRFYLDLVPARKPMIYVTQQGQPRIVLFGGRPFGEAATPMVLNKPLLVTAWTNRFMLKAEAPGEPVQLFYDVGPRANSSGVAVEPLQMAISDKLVDLILTLAHQPTPEDPATGLNMTFSEVVGLLYEIQRQNGVAAVFATESDRLGASVYEAARGTVVADRGITGDEENKKMVSFAPREPQVPSQLAPTGPGQKRIYVKPLGQPKAPNK